MPNFEFVFDKVVRIWREGRIVKKLGIFKRILVAPDKEIANQIAQAMAGETIENIEGWQIEEWYAENLEPRGKYEIGLGDMISVSQTAEEPTMGKLDLPIPNYDYIWRRVKDKLEWNWSNRIAVEFFIIEKNHALEEITRIDGIVTKHNKLCITKRHILGVKAIHNREFQSYEDCESFLRSLQASQATI